MSRDAAPTPPLTAEPAASFLPISVRAIPATALIRATRASGFASIYSALGVPNECGSPRLVPVTSCLPVTVNAVMPPHETVTKGRKKQRALPTKRSKDGMDLRFDICTPYKHPRCRLADGL